MLELLKALPPRDFEHLVYDLLIRKGLTNVRWRTPGADGGRDLEGDFPSVDFSGDTSLERWYIECKRYTQAVDWPTVFGKLAYAANHSSDYLLICTTASLSPQCKTEARRHNEQSRRPRIRAWEGADLDRLLSIDPVLLTKYGLSPTDAQRRSSLEPLLWLVSKSSQDAYGRAFLNGTPPPSLEFAAAAAELAVAMAQLDAPWFRASAQSPFRVDRDLYEWCDLLDATTWAQGWDAHAIRAMLSAIRLMTGASRLSLRPVHAEAESQLIEIRPVAGITEAAKCAFDSICLLGRLEWTHQADVVVLRSQRNEGER